MKKRPPKPPKNHHYVPQFVLRRFTDPNGVLFEYNLETGKIRHPVAVRKAAFEQNLYTRPADGDPYQVEHFFGKYVERPAAPVWEKILNKEPLEKLGEAWNDFLLFVAFQMLRTPAALELTERLITPSMEEFYKRVLHSDELKAEYRASDGIRDLSEADFEFSYREAMKNPPILKPAKEFVQSLALSTAFDRVQMLRHMSWQIMALDPADGDLMIGDHPVTTTVPPGQPVGILNRHMRIELPLSSRVVAIGEWHKFCGYGVLPPGSSEGINERTAKFARRFIYASFGCQKALRRVMELKGSGPILIRDKLPTPDGGTLFINRIRS